MRSLQFTIFNKTYELSNHLGNVLATITDRKLRVESDTVYYIADLSSVSDYYPFGSLIGSRSFSGYRFGFNGMEKDDEMKGEGNSYDFGARIYDSRISRWFTLDPLFNLMPWNSPYVFANNNPLYYIDEDGQIPWPVKKWKGSGWNTKHGWFNEPRKRKDGTIRYHNGVDINSDLNGDSDLGAPVYSTHSGKVIKVVLYENDKNGGGTRITIESANGVVRTVYMHLDETVVKEGDYVAEGQSIGYVGKSGCGKRHYEKYKAHLHYELYLKIGSEFVAIDPEGGQRNSGNLIDPQQFVTSGKYLFNWVSLFVDGGVTENIRSVEYSFPMRPPWMPVRETIIQNDLQHQSSSVRPREATIQKMQTKKVTGISINSSGNIELKSE